MDFRLYPMDTQHCPLVIESCKYLRCFTAYLLLITAQYTVKHNAAQVLLYVCFILLDYHNRFGLIHHPCLVIFDFVEKFFLKDAVIVYHP